MYVILKPEARKYIERIEEIILKEGFDIISRHHIRDWISLASKLYSPQINNDIVFAGEFEAYLWLTNHFFGNSAATLTLGREGSLEDNLFLISDLKPKIREKINGNDSIVKIFLNLDGIDRERKHPIGVMGYLGVENEGEIKLKENGRWDFFYFKYVHVPDPNQRDYEREFNILKEEGVLDNLIEQYKWDVMRRMQTLNYFSEGGPR